LEIKHFCYKQHFKCCRLFNRWRLFPIKRIIPLACVVCGWTTCPSCKLEQSSGGHQLFCSAAGGGGPELCSHAGLELLTLIPSLFCSRRRAARTLGSAFPVPPARSYCFIYPHHKQCREEAFI